MPSWNFILTLFHIYPAFSAVAPPAEEGKPFIDKIEVALIKGGEILKRVIDLAK